MIIEVGLKQNLLRLEGAANHARMKCCQSKRFILAEPACYMSIERTPAFSPSHRILRTSDI